MAAFMQKKRRQTELEVCRGDVISLKKTNRNHLNNIDGLIQHIDSLEKRLNIEVTINAQYSEFFKKTDFCNWMRDHNIQFQAFRASPYYVEPALIVNIHTPPTNHD